MIRVEFIRQLKRGRTWGLTAALVAVPLFIAFANRVQSGRRHRIEDNLFELGTRNSGNFAILILLVMSNFFLVVVVAALAGESVSGEATWGTLRYLLVRPVRRPKLILAKLLVAAVLALAATYLILVVSLVVGAILFGWGDVFTLGPFHLPELISAGDATWRLVIAAGYVTVCMFTVVGIGMFLSTLTDSTAAAVVGTIVVIVTCSVLLNVPSLQGLRPVIPTNYWDRWQGLFTSGDAGEMYKGLIETAVWTTLFSVAALVRFQRKDILS